MALVLAAAVGLGSMAAAQDEGVDLMRQITSQWVKPNIMLTFDQSGSMSFPVETGEYEWGNDTTQRVARSWWRFRYSSSLNGMAMVAADHSFVERTYAGSRYPSTGAGQGYWLRAGGVGGRQGLVRRSYLANVYVLGNPGWSTGDEIEISGLPNADDNGVFRLRTNPTRSGWNNDYWYFTVAKRRANGTYPNSNYSFTVSSDLTYMTVLEPGESLDWVWYFVPPSRMAIAKNVLGRHLTLYEPSIPESGSDEYDRPYYLFAAEDPSPDQGAYFDWPSKNWVNWSDTSDAPAGDARFTTAQVPSDLIGLFSDVINWGLVSYSGSCDDQIVRAAVNPDDSAQTAVVEAIEAHFDTIGEGGLKPYGATPTRAALATARTSLQGTAEIDGKLECGRTYGVILMTDGQSNQCNPGDDEWGGDCPDDWEDFPPGRSDDLWSDEDLNARTWVIGVSRDVGRCELNYTAFRGRSDASSPSGDAGFDTDGDPRLPEGQPGTYDASQDYAYFTNTAEELKDAFAAILAAMGAGDYSTAPPAVASSVDASGLVAFLASTRYPGWQGHLRAFDLTKAPNEAGYEMWDAADGLAGSNHGFSRRIYTWDPTDDNALVAITAGNLDDLDALCGECGLTAAVVDFIRGNDGQGNARSRKLGALINTTPAVIGPPRPFRQNQLREHSSFENDYANRHPMVWVGSSDGMVRAFDLVDGTEILALVPPDLLDLQVELYEHFADDPTSSPLGQPSLPSEHLYGVASSMRFADVYLPDDGSYRTVLFISEGPGGTGLHAIDVTHPYPGRTIGGETHGADPNYGFGSGSAGDPVAVLWSRTADGEAGTSALADLGLTWSVPAVAAVGSEAWGLQVGAGYRDNPANQAEPRVFFLDPVDGTTLANTYDSSSPELSNAATYWVTNQSFADAVFWQSDSRSYNPDNLADEGVQGDLNGHLWAIRKSGSRMAASTLLSLTDAEPLYYAPAVAGYPDTNPVEYALYAFSSGSFYERATGITGADVGREGRFVPKLYLLVRDLVNDTQDHVAIRIQDLPDPDGGTLGRRTQVTAPPMLFTPRQGSAAVPFALYLVYDPDGSTCVGTSYIVRVNFDPTDLTSLEDDLANQVEVFAAGEGAAGGFALAGSRVLVSQSAVGQDAEARLLEVPGLSIPVGGAAENVSWWVELQ